MATRRTANELIVIVGPTASGKTELALRVAKQFNGEIISADSRTIYKGLSVGTAKPNLKDQQGVRHYGFDLVEPNELFSAAQFQQLALEWIREIQAKGKLVVLVGGTGLYVDSILFNYEFGSQANSDLRQKLERFSVVELQDYCKKNSIILPKNNKNKRHLIRAIEQGGVNDKREEALRLHTIVVGIAPKKEELVMRFKQRTQKMLNQDVVRETTLVANKFGWHAPGLSGNIYPIIRRIVAKELSMGEAIEKSVIADWQLSKRQLTWFRRNPFIHWCESAEQGFEIIRKYLNKIE